MFGTILISMLKAGAATIVLAVAFTPTWIWLAVYQLVDPTTWWARLLTIGVGLFFLGIIQMICLVFGVAIIVAVLTSD